MDGVSHRDVLNSLILDRYRYVQGRIKVNAQFVLRKHLIFSLTDNTRGPLKIRFSYYAVDEIAGHPTGS